MSLLFWLIVVLIAALVLLIWRINRPADPTRGARRLSTAIAPRPSPRPTRPPSTPVRLVERRPQTLAAEVFFTAARASPFDALAHLRRGDMDGARRALQKIAYGMVRASAREKTAFTALMVTFTAIDPLYALGLSAVQPLIAAQPGIRQTALYEHMPMSTEEARYVLYFAAETGRIRRRKHGNSYRVYPPGEDALPNGSCQSPK